MAHVFEKRGIERDESYDERVNEILFEIKRFDFGFGKLERG